MLKESPVKPIRESPIKKAREEWITTEDEPVVEEENDKLNDSVNSVLATPLDVSLDEEIVSVPATQDDEESVTSQESQEDVIESSQPKENDDVSFSNLSPIWILPNYFPYSYRIAITSSNHHCRSSRSTPNKIS